MKKIVRLTESDLIRLVKRVIKESEDKTIEPKNAKLYKYWDNWLKSQIDEIVESEQDVDNKIKRLLVRIRKGEGDAYSKLENFEREELANVVEKYSDLKRKEYKNWIDDIKKNQDREETRLSKGKEFKSEKTDSGITLQWNNLIDEYQILFPQLEERNFINLGGRITDLNLGKEIFELIKNLEKIGMSSEKIYEYAEMARYK